MTKSGYKFSLSLGGKVYTPREYKQLIFEYIKNNIEHSFCQLKKEKALEAIITGIVEIFLCH